MKAKHFEIASETITDVARDLETTTRAIRYYEEIGLARADRRRGLTRLYGCQVKRRLRLIVNLRKAGVSTDEIGVLLGAQDKDVSVPALRTVLQRQIERLDHQRAGLTQSLASLDAASPCRAA